MKKKLQMLHTGKVETFEITNEGPGYIFCECLTDPAKRGFFTDKYVAENKQ